MTDEQRKQIQLQIKQLNCFLDSVYAGMAHDVKIVWNFRAGPDALGRDRGITLAVLDYWRDKYGKHEEITIGVGDAYYGSSTLSHMLYEHAYHMRERLLVQLEDKPAEPVSQYLLAT